MNIDVWQMIDEVNISLKDDFLCIPPYQRVNGKFVGDIYANLKENKSITGQIFEAVTNPSQRAYQMEYRFKKCKIFEPYLSIIEFATYTFMDGNYTCAYLSLLPVVEALLRQWGTENPNITFDKIGELTSALTKEIQKREYYPDERIAWANSHIEYFQFIVCDVLYLSFKKYRKKPFNEIFNRNLSLHIRGCY